MAQPLLSERTYTVKTDYRGGTPLVTISAYGRTLVKKKPIKFDSDAEELGKLLAGDIWNDWKPGKAVTNAPG